MSEALPYYSFDKAMSYNTPWMMVCGARGLGKTYGATRDGLRAFDRNGEQMIYLRRHQTEIDEAKGTFFDSIGDEFPEWDFKVVGNYGYAARESTRDEEGREWVLVVHFLALSSAQSLKSKDFRYVTRIIFDEFIIEKGYQKYITGALEPRVFQNFYNTVDRYKNKTRAILLSNSVSVMNPYFMRYKIDPEDGVEFIVKGRNRFLLAHIVEAKEFSDAVKRTEFGQFMDEFDPEYSSYAVDNMFSDNHDDMVRPKDKTAKYQWSLETEQGTFSIWKSTLEKHWYAQAKRPSREVMFTLMPGRITDEKPLLVNSDPVISMLRSAWRTGNMYFDHAQTRNAFQETFT